MKMEQVREYPTSKAVICKKHGPKPGYKVKAVGDPPQCVSCDIGQFWEKFEQDMDQDPVGMREAHPRLCDLADIGRRES
jgi:hypothetical protein